MARGFAARPRLNYSGRRLNHLMRTLIWMLVGGALGTGARYALTLGIGRILGARGGDFPLATMLINGAGCLVLGLVATLVAERVLSADVKTVVGTGFCGAFTTFSTYVLEFEAGWKRAPITAVFYGVGSLVLGLAALWMGQWIASSLGFSTSRASGAG